MVPIVRYDFRASLPNDIVLDFQEKLPTYYPFQESTGGCRTTQRFG